MTIPHVTITVTGSKAETPSVEVLESSLHMLYLQSLDGDKRHQWIVFPPAIAALGVADQEVESSGGRHKVLHRVQEFKGNRSKWFHQVRDVTFVTDTLTACVNQGHKVSKPVLVKLELDDYRKVWEDDTPHKAIRAIDRTIQTVLGTTTK